KIVEQEVGQIVVRDKDVREAVIIIVGKSHTHPAADARGNACLCGDIFESSIAPVPLERIRQTIKIFWVYVHAQVALTIAAVPVKIGSPVRIIEIGRASCRERV